MDVFYAYTYGTAAWLGLKGLALVSGPRLIVTLLLDESRVTPSDVEIYFSRSFGLALLAVALLTVILTGSIPLTAESAEGVSTDETDPRAPYAVPVLFITTLFHAALAFYDYTCYTLSGQVALGIGTFGSGIIASVGLWCLLFSTTRGKLDAKTGADKRTSGFPFKNAQADKRFAEKKGQ